MTKYPRDAYYSQISSMQHAQPHAEVSMQKYRHARIHLGRCKIKKAFHWNNSLICQSSSGNVNVKQAGEHCGESRGGVVKQEYDTGGTK